MPSCQYVCTYYCTEETHAIHNALSLLELLCIKPDSLVPSHKFYSNWRLICPTTMMNTVHSRSQKFGWRGGPVLDHSAKRESGSVTLEIFFKNMHAIWCIILHLLHKNHEFLSFFFFFFVFFFLFYWRGGQGLSPLAAPLEYTWKKLVQTYWNPG